MRNGNLVNWMLNEREPVWEQDNCHSDCHNDCKCGSARDYAEDRSFGALVSCVQASGPKYWARKQYGSKNKGDVMRGSGCECDGNAFMKERPDPLVIHS